MGNNEAQISHTTKIDDKLIIGNWKMHGDLALLEAMMATLREENLSTLHSDAAPYAIVICPPAHLLWPLARMLSQLPGQVPIWLGAQTCRAELKGAFTGDISAPMLVEVGCRYVIIGHSERRAEHGERDDTVAATAVQCLASGIRPICCVGESISIREQGEHQAIAFVAAQALAVLPPPPWCDNAPPMLAYEPLWAIGSGTAASVRDIAEMLGALRSTLAEAWGVAGAGVPVIYGGSVDGNNAGMVLNEAGADGVLVGGASIDAERFLAIIQAYRGIV